MSAVVAAYLLMIVIAVLVAVVAYQRGRLLELTAVAACMANDHEWRMLSSGRAGFVRWYHCARPGCQATRFVKGGRA